LFARSAKTVRQQDWIADLDAFVVNVSANGTNNASAFVAKDRGWVA
jgi:hypothetical protein